MEPDIDMLISGGIIAGGASAVFLSYLTPKLYELHRKYFYAYLEYNINNKGRGYFEILKEQKDTQDIYDNAEILAERLII